MKTAIVCFAVGVGFAYTVFDGEKPGAANNPPAPPASPELKEERVGPMPPQPGSDPVAKSAAQPPRLPPLDPKAEKAPSVDTPRPIPPEAKAEGSAPVVEASSVDSKPTQKLGSYETQEGEADRIVADAAKGINSDSPLTESEIKALLQDTLGGVDSDVSALDVLEAAVQQERMELSALVGHGDEAKNLLLQIPGFNDELEKIGIPTDIAEKIRTLSAKVLELHGKKNLADVQDLSDVRQASTATEFTSITDPAAGAADDPKKIANAKPKTRPRSSLPKLEAALLFHAGNADEALEILSKLPVGELASQDRYVLGSCLVAKHRFDEAIKVLTPLAQAKDSDALAQAADRQLKRMEMIEAGLVGLDPLVKALEEGKK